MCRRAGWSLGFQPAPPGTTRRCAATARSGRRRRRGAAGASRPSAGPWREGSSMASAHWAAGLPLVESAVWNAWCARSKPTGTSGRAVLPVPDHQAGRGGGPCSTAPSRRASRRTRAGSRRPGPPGRRRRRSTAGPVPAGRAARQAARNAEPVSGRAGAAAPPRRATASIAASRGSSGRRCAGPAGHRLDDGDLAVLPSGVQQQARRVPGGRRPVRGSARSVGGLGADHRAGAVVPADLRVAAWPAAVVEELQRRLVVRVGRADADRGVQAADAEQAGQVLAEQRAAVGRRTGAPEDRRARRHGPAGRRRPGTARTLGGRSALYASTDAAVDPARRERQQEAGPVERRDDGVPGRRRSGSSPSRQPQAGVGENGPGDPAEAVRVRADHPRVDVAALGGNHP